MKELKKEIKRITPDWPFRYLGDDCGYDMVGRASTTWFERTSMSEPVVFIDVVTGELRFEVLK